MKNAIGERKAQTYFGAVTANPGVYTLKLAVVDTAGKRGSVEHAFRAQLSSVGQIRMTISLIADRKAGAADGLTPAVSADFTGDNLQAYIEVYSDLPELLKNATMVVEVAANDKSRALDTAAAQFAPGNEPQRKVVLRAAEGDLEAALASCEQALEVHERMPAPFERARTLLIYGTILRRIKRRKAAREAIEAALSIFEALPAPVWAVNARAELARTGGRAPSGDGLTEGERRIAELVAAGKSNKETAATLFLSVHTVEDALKRIYRKLDVRSRTELSRRLSADP